MFSAKFDIFAIMMPLKSSTDNTCALGLLRVEIGLQSPKHTSVNFFFSTERVDENAKRYFNS